MKEIVVQSAGNAAQQGNVDVVLVENLVHMGPRTANVFGQLGGRSALLSHDFLDMLPDVHRKSVELISCLKLGVTTPHIPNKSFHAVQIRHLTTCPWYVCPQRGRW